MFRNSLDTVWRAVGKSRFLGVALVSIAALAIVGGGRLVNLTMMEEFENRTWDWRLRLVADRKKADPSIKLIIIDQGTLDFFEREYGVTWPFPRDLYRYVIDFLQGAGARGLAFDLLFTESAVQAVETDQILAEASGGAFPVIHAVTMESSEKLLRREKFEQFAQRQKQADAQRHFSTRYLGGGGSQKFVSATLPIPELLEKARGFGSVSATPDSDGIFRHYNIGGMLEGIPVLSLPFEFHDLVTQGKSSFPISRFLDPQGRLAIRLHGASGTYQGYPLHVIAQSQQLLAEGQKPLIDPAEFRDTWVILGVWAPGLLDLRPTPLEEKGKGVEYVAAVLDNLLHEDFIRTFPRSVELSIAAATIVVTAAAVFLLANPLLQMAALLAVFSGFGSLALWLAAQGIWLPVFVPSTGMILAVTAALGLRFQIEGRQHRFVRGAFQYYVSKGVIDQIMVDPSKLSLGGEKRDLTIFFSDIKGFTSISEKLDPTALVQLLNDYLTELTNIILNSGGTLDKYVGDAIVAFWNAPLTVQGHARQGLEAAIACQRALAAHRPRFRELYGVDVHTRIGLHSGPVSVGNFGSRTRFNYTMIGDAANLASRLEGVNKNFGTSILISAETLMLTEGAVPCRKVADLRVVGKNEVITVYQPQIDDAHLFEAGHLRQYQQAMGLFEAGNLTEAREIFIRLDRDPVATRYVQRIDQELGTKNTVWSPVWNMTDK